MSSVLSFPSGPAVSTLPHDPSVAGWCQFAATKMAKQFPELRLARGWYGTPQRKSAHWWCVAVDGTIVDPTGEQFKERGLFDRYIELDVNAIACTGCTSTVAESDPSFYVVADSPFCSKTCAGASSHCAECGSSCDKPGFFAESNYAFCSGRCFGRYVGCE
jgi:hypothetical protein